jgi:hypothetical protein
MLKRMELAIVFSLACLVMVSALPFVPALYGSSANANISTASSGNTNIQTYKLNSQEALQKFEEGNVSAALLSLKEANQQFLSNIGQLGTTENMTNTTSADLEDPLKFKRRNITNFVNATELPKSAQLPFCTYLDLMC